MRENYYQIQFRDSLNLKLTMKLDDMNTLIYNIYKYKYNYLSNQWDNHKIINIKV